MRKVIGLILLAILWGRYLYAVEFPQVIIGGKTKCVKMNETQNQWKAL